MSDSDYEGWISMSYPAGGWQEAVPDRGVAGRWCARPYTWPTGGGRRPAQVDS